MSIELHPQDATRVNMFFAKKVFDCLLLLCSRPIAATRMPPAQEKSPKKG
jgi:hypothetical protein